MYPCIVLYSMNFMAFHLMVYRFLMYLLGKNPKCRTNTMVEAISSQEQHQLVSTTAWIISNSDIIDQQAHQTTWIAMY